MSSISLDDVKKLATLSALMLDDEEVVAMQSDLAQVLEYVEHLSSVDTTGVEPTYEVHSLSTVVRKDELIDYGVKQSGLLRNAPEQVDNMIVVPKVLS